MFKTYSRDPEGLRKRMSILPDITKNTCEFLMEATYKRGLCIFQNQDSSYRTHLIKGCLYFHVRVYDGCNFQE